MGVVTREGLYVRFYNASTCTSLTVALLMV